MGEKLILVQQLKTHLKSLPPILGLLGLFLISPQAVWADDYYFTLNSAPGVTTNPGDAFTTTTPTLNSYTPTNITATPLYFYTNALNCTYNPGSFTVSLITSQISGNTDMVNVEVDVVNSSGGGITPVNNQTLNVDATCTAPTGDACNGLTTFTITSTGSLSLVNELFCVKITLVSGNSAQVTSYGFPSSTAFVPGTDWISGFTTPLNSCDPPTVTPTPLPCGYSPDSISSGTGTYIWSSCYGAGLTAVSTTTVPPPDGSGNNWNNPSYDYNTSTGWNPAVIVPTPETGWAQPCSISNSGTQSYWTSVVANQQFATPTPGSGPFSPCGGSFYYLNYFTIPTPQPGYTITSATLSMAADDGNQSGEAINVYLNGNTVPGTSTVSFNTCTTINVPVSDFILTGTGNNVLAVYDSNGQGYYQGIVYQFLFAQTGPTCTATNTPTNTPTNALTNTPTNTSTSTPAISSTFTNTPTTTPTNTTTNTVTSTGTNTVTETVTSTGTDTPTNTTTNTETSTGTNTVTETVTSTGTNTPTNTFTNTPTVTVTNTVTNTSTFTYTSSPTNTPTLSPTVTNTSILTPTPSPTPGISMVKSVSETQAHAGDTLTYTIAVTISGNAITGMVITDTLPVGVTFSSFVTTGSTVVGTFNKNTDLMQWVMPSSLAPGIYDLIYQTQVNPVVAANVPIVNKAQLTYPGQGSSLISSAPVTVLGQFTVNVNVYNSAGEVVKTFPVQQFTQAIDNITLQSSNTITTLNGPGSTIEIFYDGVLIGTWNGTNNANQPVSNGQYIIKIDNVSAQGLVTSVSQAAIVNRNLSNITANIYNSAGEIVKTLYEVVSDPVVSSMTGVNLNANAFMPGGPVSQGNLSQVQVVIQTSGTPVTLVWDGTNNSDTVVTPGEYEIEVHWNNGSGETADISRQIMVLAGSGVGGVAIARPNVLGGTNGLTTTFDGTGVPNAYTVNVKIYTVAGELVKLIAGTAGTAQVQWTASGIASGIYITAVEIDNANGGLINRQFLKVLVEH